MIFKKKRLKLTEEEVKILDEFYSLRIQDTAIVESSLYLFFEELQFRVYDTLESRKKLTYSRYNSCPERLNNPNTKFYFKKEYELELQEYIKKSKDKKVEYIYELAKKCEDIIWKYYNEDGTIKKEML